MALDTHPLLPQQPVLLNLNNMEKGATTITILVKVA